MGKIPNTDETHLFILKNVMKNGYAPFYTEVANHFGCSVEEGRKAVRDVFEANVPGWQYPGTDYIVSYPPFNNLPTEYRITIDGQSKWTAQ